MALNLQPGDEVITVNFTFIATVEVIALLKLTPVLVDVSIDNFTMDIDALKKAITPKTKAIIPVHLFGQCANMNAIMQIARENNLYVIEDAAQALGAKCTINETEELFAGTIGDIGCTSFFPSKNLGGYGDGGAVFTNKTELAEKIRSMANHGMTKRYFYEHVGINSRLDAIQAALLRVKLKKLNEYLQKRQEAANYYKNKLCNHSVIKIPHEETYSTHTYNQFTLQVPPKTRNDLQSFLQRNGIPTMIYYPKPLHEQEAYKNFGFEATQFSNSYKLCESVVSIPIHTELEPEQLQHISNTILEFYR